MPSMPRRRSPTTPGEILREEFLRPLRMTQKQLADLCALDKTTMVVTMDALERDGLAERRPSPTDRRARIIAVTDAGRSVITDGEAIVSGLYDDVLTSIPSEQREPFLSALQGLLDGRLAEPPECQSTVRRPRSS